MSVGIFFHMKESFVNRHESIVLIQQFTQGSVCFSAPKYILLMAHGIQAKFSQSFTLLHHPETISEETWTYQLLEKAALVICEVSTLSLCFKKGHGCLRTNCTASLSFPNSWHLAGEKAAVDNKNIHVAFSYSSTWTSSAPPTWVLLLQNCIGLYYPLLLPHLKI